MDRVRRPYVSGYFYPNKPDRLKKTLLGFIDKKSEKKKAKCLVSPHAGFEYSGSVAGAVYSSAKIPDKIVLLGPSHRGIQAHFGIMGDGFWETPLGKTPVDTDLTSRILETCSFVSEDEQGHAFEHSLEVQLPFLQIFNESVSIVPICISYLASFDSLESLGKAVAAAIRDLSDEVLIVASTDMSHQVSQETAKKKDFLAIEKVLNLDAAGLYEVVQKQRISMCGFQATTASLIAACDLGAKKAELIKYRTSGDVTGDYQNVVGYAGIRIS